MQCMGTGEAAPLLEEHGIGGVAPHVPNDTYPFDPFLKTSEHGWLCSISKIIFENGCCVELVDGNGEPIVVTIHELKNLVDNNIWETLISTTKTVIYKNSSFLSLFISSLPSFSLWFSGVFLKFSKQKSPCPIFHIRQWSSQKSMA